MASDGNPVAISASGAIVSSQPADLKSQAPSGKVLSQGDNTPAASGATTPSVSSGVAKALLQGGKSVSQTTASVAAASRADPQALVDQVNKFLNDSGRPDQFRVDPNSGQYIQQVNPSNGTVVAQYLVSEFPALARSVGASGLLIDSTA